MAAFDGDIDQGKVEVGQSVGLIDELLPAAELVQRLIAEFESGRTPVPIPALRREHETRNKDIRAQGNKMSDLLIEDRGGVRIRTMNRPDKRNALNHALTQALLAALHDTESDEGVRSIVLTGSGSAFCAGA